MLDELLELLERDNNSSNQSGRRGRFGRLLGSITGDSDDRHTSDDRYDTGDRRRSSRTGTRQDRSESLDFGD